MSDHGKPTSEAIRGILFDKDGTLRDYAATWHPSNRQVALSLAEGDSALAERLLRIGGHDPESDRVTAGSTLSSGNTIEIAELWIDLLRDDWSLAELISAIDQAFLSEGLRNATAVPGLAQTLSALKAEGLHRGVATNDSETAARATLRELRLLEIFDFVAGYDSGHGGKPEPGMVTAFCRSTGLQPAQVAVVGDSEHDLEMGRRAGAGLLVGVLTGTGDRPLLQSFAHHVVDSVADLKSLL